jgi:hypothetical protein
MGNPKCDRCGEEITQEQAIVQVICTPADYRDDDDLEHLAYFHRSCWDAWPRTRYDLAFAPPKEVAQ